MHLPELEIARRCRRRAARLPQAEQYTHWLATHHYENFHVVSWLLPRRLQQHFYNVYAYCRWADDLGDEVGDTARALELLDWWERSWISATPASRPIPFSSRSRRRFATSIFPRSPSATC